MNFYFTLQYRRMDRKLREAGIHPVLGMALFAMAFVALTEYLFSKTDIAAWIYGILAVSVLLQLGDKERNEPLQVIFSKQHYVQLRLVENGLTVLPFALYLLFKNHALIALGLIPISMALAAFNTRQRFRFVTPTPFKKFPFEFIVGFRKSWWLLAVGYFLTIKAIQVGNFNLGLFSLALIFLVGMSFYFKAEKEYFVWIFAMDVTAFLRKKILAALICISMLSLPILIALYSAFPEDIFTLIGFQLLGYLFLCSMVLAKYSAFPNEMNLPQAILYGLCLWFPPMLLIIIPIFYVQAKRRLKVIVA